MYNDGTRLQKVQSQDSAEFVYQFWSFLSVSRYPYNTCHLVQLNVVVAVLCEEFMEQVPKPSKV